MDLLIEIKRLYSLLFDAKVIEAMPSYEEIEEIAEECFHKKYKKIDKFLIPLFSNEYYAQIKEKVERIKELTK